MKCVHIPEARWCLEWPRNVFICHEDIWTCVHSHENQPNSLTKGLFWAHHRTAGLAVSRTPMYMTVLDVLWNCSVCALGYDSMLSKHIQMLTPGLLALLHVNIPSCLPCAPISWESSDVEWKWLYHTHSVWKVPKITLLSIQKNTLLCTAATCQQSGGSNVGCCARLPSADLL